MKLLEKNIAKIDIIKKYTTSGPRYTSYPTAAQFADISAVQSKELYEYLINRNQIARPISLYFHIPFCFSLCWYCGCTKIITKDSDRGDAYLAYLEIEMEKMSKIIHLNSEVVQIHFGGGTPTFLNPQQLKRLGDAISSRFNLTEKTEFSVEIDPRKCNEEQVKTLAEIGCNRASLGVQDTNEDVQRTINRIQPFEQTKHVTEWLRNHGIQSINYDLIYGLPKQNSATFKQTMDDVLTVMPDRLAVYSYAHIPELMPSQKLLKTEDFPSTDEKLNMLQYSIDYLTERGYRFIGMDHFSKEDEELTKAMDNGSLQRNFQGYSTKAGTDLYAFGMSGISQVGEWYWQNSKEISTYYKKLETNEFTFAKAIRLNRDDFIRREVIMNLMCKMSISFEKISKKWDIQFEKYFHSALENLSELEKDGFVEISDRGISIAPEGRLFLRNIAMCFDYYLLQSKKNHRFSNTV